MKALFATFDEIRLSRHDAYRGMRDSRHEERLRGKISLAGIEVPKRQTKAIFKSHYRRSLLSTVALYLSTASASKFEREGDVRHGLRSALCLEGHPWLRADEEAAELVREGLKRVRAVRPTWNEGQWFYTVSPDFCIWCHRPIDEWDRTRGQKFCSVICARNALNKRDYEAGWSRSLIGQSAYVLITRKGRPPVACKACGTLFHPRHKTSVYCSQACGRSARGDLLADRNCLWCGKIFHPSTHHVRCCSASCGAKERIRRLQQSRPERHCAHCQAIFRPKSQNAKYCSATCANRVYGIRYWARQRERERSLVVTPAIFDEWFRTAA